jgi:hypothetical protein
MTRRSLLLALAAAAKPERRMWLAARYDAARVFFLERGEAGDESWSPDTLPRRAAPQTANFTEAELFAAAEADLRKARLKPPFGLRPGATIGLATSNHGILECRLDELLICEDCGGPQPAALARLESAPPEDFYLAWRKSDEEPHYHAAGQIQKTAVPTALVEPLLKIALRDMPDGTAKARLFAGKGRLETAALAVPIGATAMSLSVRAAWFLEEQPALAVHAWAIPGPPPAIESGERWWDMASDDSLSMEATQNLDDLPLVAGHWTLDGVRYVLLRGRQKEGYLYEVLRRAEVAWIETGIRYSSGC